MEHDHTCYHETLLRQKLPAELLVAIVAGLTHVKHNKDRSNMGGLREMCHYHEHDSTTEAVKECKDRKAKQRCWYIP
jgi:hypothetical protein